MENTEEEETITFLEAEEALRKSTISCNKFGVPEAATVHLEHLKRLCSELKLTKRRRTPTFMTSLSQARSPRTLRTHQVGS